MKKIIPIFIVLLLSLSACDSGLYINKISIYKFPDRITYFISRDEKLDLDGLEIIVETKEGSQSIKKWNEMYNGRPYFKITNSINFSKAGVSFAVEVIDINNLK